MPCIGWCNGEGIMPGIMYGTMYGDAGDICGGGMVAKADWGGSDIGPGCEPFALTAERGESLAGAAVCGDWDELPPRCKAAEDVSSGERDDVEATRARDVPSSAGGETDELSKSRRPP